MTTAIEIPLAESVPSRISNLKLRRLGSPAVLVTALTLLGTTLRFSFLDRPPIWGDEAMTYMRVSATYKQLLDALQDWGFAPLHYELYWVMRQLTPLTPFMMRLPTAIAGTLMVPVMYWLALQVTGSRKVGLVTALFTATSAFLCNYSRDAKMYMDFWFFCALNFACLLWWLRVRTRSEWEGEPPGEPRQPRAHGSAGASPSHSLRTRVAWWSWVASGVAMMGLNLLGGMLIAIELLAVLIWPARQWRPWIPRGLITTNLFLLGVIIMALGPAGYYMFFNRYAERLDRAGGLHGGGLQWIEPYNRGRSAGDLVLFTSTAHLYSWEWPRPLTSSIKDQEEINRHGRRWLKMAGISILALLAAGLFPWPRHWTGMEAGESAPRTNWWRSLSLVLIWIIIPAYGFYCASVKGFASPPSAVAGLFFRQPQQPQGRGTARDQTLSERWSAEWERLKLQCSRENLRRPNWWQWTLIVAGAVAIGACFYFCGDSLAQRLAKLAILLMVTIGLLLICTIIFMAWSSRYSGSLWMPRYLGIVWPAVAIVGAVLLLRLPMRPLRWTAIALLVAVNLSVFSARVFAGSEPPTPLMARDLLDSQPDNAKVRMYYGISALRVGSPGSGMLSSVPGAYYLTILSGRPTYPQEMIGAFAGGRFGNFKRWQSLLPLSAYVTNDVNRNPHLETIIVWEKFDRGKLDDADPIGERLGTNWRRREQAVFAVRDHWTWRHLMSVRRRVYERTGPPTTLPSTQPTSAPATTQSR